MTPDQFVAKARSDFRWFSRGYKVLDKQAHLVPFRLNAAQERLLAAIEHQLSTRGRVRLVILKARQLGLSTGIQGYLLWRAMLWPGFNAFTLTHKGDATANLSAMATRFWDHLPEVLRPSLDKRNESELAFRMGSRYQFGTAGAKATGRSATLQGIHASEMAFWEKASEHAAGLNQALAGGRGTFHFIESTAYGMTGSFYQAWLESQRPGSDWAGLFIPWFVDAGYQAEPPQGWRPSDEAHGHEMSDQEYMTTHGLSLAQMWWREGKLRELAASGLSARAAFQQEYPATPSEAFAGEAGDSFINPLHVQLARQRNLSGNPAVGRLPLLIGCDCGREHGEGRTAIIRRQGPRAYDLEWHRNLDHKQIAWRLREIAVAERPVRLCIDYGDVGQAVCTELRAWEETHRLVVPVKFGARPSNPVRFGTKRDEIWTHGRDWLRGDVSIPDDEGLVTDLLAVRAKTTSERYVRLEAKADIIPPWRHLARWRRRADDHLRRTRPAPRGKHRPGHLRVRRLRRRRCAHRLRWLRR